MRVVAKHDWPALRVTAATAAETAASRSASSRTIVGDLPPSSRLTGTMRRAAAAITAAPVATEPVNVTWPTSGWSTTAAPVGSPRPTTMLHAPGRQPRLGEQRGGGEARQRRDLGRLDQDGVSGGERRRDAAGHLAERRVPRRDVRDHPERLAARVDERAVRAGDRLAAELVRRPRVELEVARGGRDVRAGLAERLAAVARLELGQLFGVHGQRRGERASTRPRSAAPSAPQAPS